MVSFNPMEHVSKTVQAEFNYILHRYFTVMNNKTVKMNAENGIVCKIAIEKLTNDKKYPNLDHKYTGPSTETRKKPY